MTTFFHPRRGYLLLSLLLAFSVLALSTSVGILERDTKLKRFSEADLKLNIDTFRRGIDLFRYHYTVTTPDLAKITALDSALKNGPISQVIDLLVNESYIRGRLATGTMKWRLVANLVRNPSFEEDLGRSGAAVHSVGTWKGNFTSNDQVPDDWELTADGAHQWIPSTDLSVPATYVVSFWGKAASPTAVIQMKVWPEVGPLPIVALSLNKPEWKRAFASFGLSAMQNLRIELLQTSANSGDVAYIDGVMLEKWNPPPGAPATLTPAPSAWADGFTIAPELASETLQQGLLQEMLPQGVDPASLSYWTEW